MTEQKIYDLATKLLAKTRSVTLTWESTPSGEAFLTSLAAFSVKVSRVWDEYGHESNVMLSISGSDGRAVESSVDNDLAEKLKLPAVVQTMGELYTEARRAALGVDAALDQLLAELD
ncbi:MAG: hypothetical protein ABSH56_28495 [Bryobacteraceae bacterium]|jgi:hypothetical protein